MPIPSRKFSVRTIVGIVFKNFLVLALMLALVEGFSSIAVTIQSNDFFGAKRNITPHKGLIRDKELGWTAEKNAFYPDCFGPGLYLRTNSLGLRNNMEFTSNVPQDKVRILSSGDFFCHVSGSRQRPRMEQCITWPVQTPRRGSSKRQLIGWEQQSHWGLTTGQP